MYKKLLGDCFLLTIGPPKASRDKKVHILIDCGVLQHVPGEAKLMQAVADDIVKTTEGRLDLLIITHEHWDHISGFSHARAKLIDNMLIDELWLAWTERRGDDQADTLRAKSEKAKVVVSRIAALAASAGNNVTASIENFNGPISGAGRLLAADIIPSLIKRASETGRVAYLEPGETRDTPGAHKLCAHVLGPPRTPTRLTKEKPSAGAAKETYLAEKFELDLNERYAAAASLGDALDAGGSTPFAGYYSIEQGSITNNATDEDIKWLWEQYLAPDQDWRNVDDAWLGAAGALALKLDSDTNNTSLALALEIEPGGNVLLFPGDAQVGNWLSWHDQTYPAAPPSKAKSNGKAKPNDSEAPKVSARDLMARTTLYKVGHHASHNATLDTQGLALMTHAGLVAMIPVVEAEARRVKDGKAVHRGWDMPYPELLKQLVARTSGRVLRGDAEPGKDPQGQRLQVDDAFLKRVTSTELFVEYQVR
jgi:hypothetical protein